MISERVPVSTRRFTLLLSALLLLLLMGPFLHGLRGGRLALALAGTAIPLAGAYAVGDGSHRRRTAMLLALPGVAANLWWLLFGSGAVRVAAPALPLAFFGYAAFVIGRHVFRAERVTADTLAGAACVYLLIGVTWWFAYLTIEALLPGSFAGASSMGSDGGQDLLYFSFVTLTTVGFGDIAPVTPPARAFAMVEAIVGVLFLAILIARLVGLYREAPPAGG